MLEERIHSAQTLLEAHEAYGWLTDRVQQVVSLCAPGHRGGRNNTNPKPPMHPSLPDWWWNGARMREIQDFNERGMTVRVSSYIGCNETAYATLFLPMEWLTAEEPAELVQAHIAQAMGKKAEQEHREKARLQAEESSKKFALYQQLQREFGR